MPLASAVEELVDTNSKDLGDDDRDDNDRNNNNGGTGARTKQGRALVQRPAPGRLIKKRKI